MSRPRRARSVTQTTSSNAALCHSKFKSGENHGVVLAFRDMEKGKLWTTLKQFIKRASSKRYNCFLFYKSETINSGSAILLMSCALTLVNYCHVSKISLDKGFFVLAGG